MKNNHTPNQVLDFCESTNDVAKKLGEEGASHGTWVSARNQTRGRGRMGREWISGDGNLFFSMVLRPPQNHPVSTTPLCVALELMDSILELKKITQLKIKWPNDLVIKSNEGVQKVAGILCEGVGSSSESFIVAGIGVNCSQAPITNQPTASLGLNPDLLRERLIERLPKVFDHPWKMQRERYQEFALFGPGDEIHWSSTTEDHDQNLFSGRVESYGDFGELCVIGDDGVLKKLYSEEIRIQKTSRHFA